MLKIDLIDFVNRRAVARLENVTGSTIVGPIECPFSESDVTLVDIRQAVRPQMLAVRDAEKVRLEALAAEAATVDASN